MFKGTIAALKAAEEAAQKDLDALFVPYDPQTGGGGVHWHAAGSGILQNAILGIGGLREDLEKREAPIAQAEADAKAAAAAAGATPEEPATSETPAEEATETPAVETAETLAAPAEVTTSA